MKENGENSLPTALHLNIWKTSSSLREMIIGRTSGDTFQDGRVEGHAIDRTSDSPKKNRASEMANI